MTLMDRHRVNWSGFVGGPGVSTFYCVSSFPMNAHLNWLFAALSSFLPTDVHLTFDPTGDTIESTTGALTGTWSDTASAAVDGTNSAAYSAVSGALIRWVTNAVLSGRKLRGHTFLVPFAGDTYDTSGQISSTNVALITGAVQALATAMSGTMLIWERPRLARAAYTDRRGVTHPAITARAGAAAAVQTATCRPTVTELRSRRD